MQDLQDLCAGQPRRQLVCPYYIQCTICTLDSHVDVVLVLVQE